MMRGDAEKSIPWDRHKKDFPPYPMGQKLGKGYPFKAFNMPVFLGC